MIEVKSKYGSVRVIADSICSNSKIRMTTFEWEFHRWILAEANTHRMISKNLQSSRAIPLKKAIEMIKENPAYPVHWGKNQSGMQSKEELNRNDIELVRALWDKHRDDTISLVQELEKLGAHKQWASRLLEAHVMTKGVFSGTDWANLMYLRDDEEAQPEFQDLATANRLAFEQSAPVELFPGEWHLPYVESRRDSESRILRYFDSDGIEIDLETAKKISGSCCAQVSYRRLNDTREKALEIYDKLFSGRKPHMSPVEHQATPIRTTWNGVYPINEVTDPSTWEPGITHMDRNDEFHSGNLRGWVQLRQTLPNNVVAG